MRHALLFWGFCLLLAAPPAALGGPAGLEAGGGKGVNEPLSVEWNLTRSGNTLHISYTLHNNGHEKVYVLDQMVAARGQAFERLPQAIVVKGGEEPGSVDFVRGYVNPGHPVLFQYAPAARSLEPGQSLMGTAEVGLPLSAWHPYGHPAPIKGTPQYAVLEVGYISGGDLKWTKVPLKDGTSLSAPALPTAVSQQRMVRGAQRPLPPK